jgi:hypothetical protein
MIYYKGFFGIGEIQIRNLPERANGTLDGFAGSALDESRILQLRHSNS